jgi:hypothetical protein
MIIELALTFLRGKTLLGRLEGHHQEAPEEMMPIEADALLAIDKGIPTVQ